MYQVPARAGWAAAANIVAAAARVTSDRQMRRGVTRTLSSGTSRTVRRSDREDLSAGRLLVAYLSKAPPGVESLRPSEENHAAPRTIGDRRQGLRKIRLFGLEVGS